jgi:hypothetical protein
MIRHAAAAARRREAMINAIATVLGCMALVVMIATWFAWSWSNYGSPPR